MNKGNKCQDSEGIILKWTFTIIFNGPGYLSYACLISWANYIESKTIT